MVLVMAWDDEVRGLASLGLALRGVWDRLPVEQEAKMVLEAQAPARLPRLLDSQSPVQHFFQARCALIYQGTEAPRAHLSLDCEVEFRLGL
jgi:hypothetical protein